jgi:hypothetical protein
MHPARPAPQRIAFRRIEHRHCSCVVIARPARGQADSGPGAGLEDPDAREPEQDRTRERPSEGGTAPGLNHEEDDRGAERHPAQDGTSTDAARTDVAKVDHVVKLAGGLRRAQRTTAPSRSARTPVRAPVPVS